MIYNDFGKTGLKVSVAGLGCGGHSRLGQSQGASIEASVNVVRAALDLGVNLIDTAAGYRTEEIVGQALKGKRDNAIISTKAPIKKDGEYVTPAQLRESLESSLSKLSTDYVDVLHLHAVGAPDYNYCTTQLVPELIKLREEGKIRFLGVTEKFIVDTRHDMAKLAIKDDFWDVMMVGFNLLNPSARAVIFPETQKKGIATLGMFAVRRALSNPEALVSLLNELAKTGLIDPSKFDMSDPLGFLTETEASSLTNAAYRFCRHEPGMDVVLTGTGKIAHLQENVASILNGPLGEQSQEKLAEMFGHIDSVSGN